MEAAINDSTSGADRDEGWKVDGGKSTGARTPEGRERIRRAVTKHGLYSAAAVLERREARQMRRLVLANIARLNELLGKPE